MRREVVIAAHDTAPALKELADYVCLGRNDQETWRQMLADLAADG